MAKILDHHHFYEYVWDFFYNPFFQYYLSYYPFHKYFAKKYKLVQNHSQSKFGKDLTLRIGSIYVILSDDF